VGHDERLPPFLPVSSSASTQQLVGDADQLSRRFDTLNDQSDSVVVRGRTIVVLGGTRLPVPESILLESGTIHGAVPIEPLYRTGDEHDARPGSGDVFGTLVFSD
jgi:hypothetical protein